MTAAALDRFLHVCADEIDRRANLAVEERDVLRDGAAAFRSALATSTALDAKRTTVPVASYLAHIEPPTATTRAAQEAAAEIQWIASPRLADGGTEAALAPLNETRDFGPLTCGLLLLRPNGSYPVHSHPPQELYLPIADGGRWRYGGSDAYRMLGPDSLAYNKPNDLHAITAGDCPLLAMYVLWP